MEKMIKGTEKMRVAGEIYSFRTDRPMRLMVELFDLLINETREENDMAELDRIKFNQGKIAAYRGLKRVIEVGVGVK
jgi:hypothetical protein